VKIIRSLFSDVLSLVTLLVISKGETLEQAEIFVIDTLASSAYSCEEAVVAYFIAVCCPGNALVAQRQEDK
jgi:hypothetical protein